jgi:hypothetical protein
MQGGDVQAPMNGWQRSVDARARQKVFGESQETLDLGFDGAQGGDLVRGLLTNTPDPRAPGTRDPRHAPDAQPFAAAGPGRGSPGAAGGASGAPAQAEMTVRRVDPEYPPPPGTPAQLEALRTQIATSLGARAEAERDAADMDRSASELQSRADQAEQAAQGVDRGMRATEAHAQATERRREAVAAQQAREAEAQNQTSDAAAQLAGAGTLLTLLSGWATFTGYAELVASLFSDDAAAAFRQMNTEASTFMVRLVQIRGTVAQQRAAGPGRQAAHETAQQRVQGVQAQAGGTGAALAQARQGAQQAAGEHRALEADARAQAEAARGDAQEAASVAEQRQAEHDSLARQLEAWAAEHREARRRAVDATCLQLESQGFRIRERSTW